MASATRNSLLGFIIPLQPVGKVQTPVRLDGCCFLRPLFRLRTCISSSPAPLPIHRPCHVITTTIVSKCCDQDDNNTGKSSSKISSQASEVVRLGAVNTDENSKGAFYNIRGKFGFGPINVGTHVSLVQGKDTGFWYFLDSYTLSRQVKDQVNEIMGVKRGKEKIEAIFNLHPFHTIHVVQMHKSYPGAKIYGTQRHFSKYPDLPWETKRLDELGFSYPPEEEQPDLSKLKLRLPFEETDLEFSLPAGIDLEVSTPGLSQAVHFGSVLVYHKSSKTIHVDDTFNYTPTLDILALHPTLPFALQKRAGASREFREWVNQIAEKWGDAENIATAHTWYLSKEENKGKSIKERILASLDAVEIILKAHERIYG